MDPDPHSFSLLEEKIEEKREKWKEIGITCTFKF